MNKGEYELYGAVAARPQINMLGIGDLIDQSDRTLMYGYEIDRSDVHVFIRDGVLKLLCYDGDEILFKQTHMLDIDRCSPSKRVYPDATDYEFAVLMKNLGYPLTFTTMNDTEWLPGPDGYYGKVF